MKSASQQRADTIQFYVYKVTARVDFTETQRLLGPEGAKDGELLFNGYMLSILENDKSSGVGHCTTMSTELYT